MGRGPQRHGSIFSLLISIIRKKTGKKYVSCGRSTSITKVFFSIIEWIQQQHRRGPILRYNSVDDGLLASPYNPSTYMYTNTNLVLPSHYQHSHRLVQLQPQPPLLPLPTAVNNRPQRSSLPLRTSSVKLINRVTRKPKSHDSAGNPKSNYQKKESACLKEQRAASKKMIRSGQCITDVSKEDERVISDHLAFILSPHPSSLPLPKFFMRQREANKLSCKAEAKAGSCASDNGLRRVLQLP